MLDFIRDRRDRRARRPVAGRAVPRPLPQLDRAVRDRPAEGRGGGRAPRKAPRPRPPRARPVAAPEVRPGRPRRRDRGGGRRLRFQGRPHRGSRRRATPGRQRAAGCTRCRIARTDLTVRSSGVRHAAEVQDQRRGRAYEVVVEEIGHDALGAPGRRPPSGGAGGRGCGRWPRRRAAPRPRRRPATRSRLSPAPSSRST